jgi:hypothetical protein
MEKSTVPGMNTVSPCLCVNSTIETSGYFLRMRGRISVEVSMEEGEWCDSMGGKNGIEEVV